jgi:hypothetical protein
MKMKSIKIMVAGILAVPLMSISAGLFIPTNTFAQDTSTNCDDTTLTINNGANCSKGTNTPDTLFGEGGIFQTIVNVFLYIIGAIAVLMLVYGGIRYTISGGDAKNVTAAKDTILYGVVGIVVAILAYAIVNFVIGELAPSTNTSSTSSSVTSSIS